MWAEFMGEFDQLSDYQPLNKNSAVRGEWTSELMKSISPSIVFLYAN
jgi:hypothetical protein